MALTAKDICVLKYLNKHCKSPDLSGAVDLVHDWTDAMQSASPQAKHFLAGGITDWKQLEATVSRLAQKGLVDRHRNLDLKADISLWITPDGQDEVEQAEAARFEATHAVPTIAAADKPATPDARAVFVVHGRDEKLTASMFALLRALDLRPREWTELVQATGRGSPYNGEVVERALEIAQGIVVMLTPDDETRLRSDLCEKPDEGNLERQPRPNVLIELGMALARCEERTVIVEFGKMRGASDIHGRNVVRVSNDNKWRNALASRLETCGCDVKKTGDSWLDVGDFTLPSEIAAAAIEPRGSDAAAAEPDHLIESERQLLRAAASDGHIFNSPMNYGDRIFAGDQPFFDPTDPAIAAAYLEAIESLISKGLVKSDGEDNWRLTKKGFEMGRTLRAGPELLPQRKIVVGKFDGERRLGRGEAVVVDPIRQVAVMLHEIGGNVPGGALIKYRLSDKQPDSRYEIVGDPLDRDKSFA